MLPKFSIFMSSENCCFIRICFSLVKFFYLHKELILKFFQNRVYLVDRIYLYPYPILWADVDDYF